MERFGRGMPVRRALRAVAAVLLLVVSAGLGQSADFTDPNTPPESTEPKTPATTPAIVPVPVPAPKTVASATKPGAGQPASKRGDGPAAGAKDAPSGLLRMTRPGAFDVNFLGTDIRLALRLLGTQARRNIIATKEVTGTVTADLYGVTFDEAFEAILDSSGYVFEKKDTFIHVMTAKQKEDKIAAGREMQTRVYRLSYVTAADAKVLIEPALSSSGKVALSPAASKGIAPDTTAAGGDAYASNDVLVALDYEENLDRIAEILAALDVRPRQVLIEATLLRATLTENNALGVDFNTLAGIDFQQLGSTSPGLQSVSTGTISDGTLPNNTPGVTFRTDFNSAIPAGGLSIGFIANEAAFFIRALEQVTDVTVMANPKLLVLNKHRGEVMVGNRDGYLTTTVTETVATQTVQFLETGTRLVVRPFIARDGYVRLEIHPEDSSGSVQPVGTSVLPSETTTEVTSNVLVRDGHTIIIGGLFRERTTTSRSQIPILGNLPYVGSVFRRTIDDTVREEVIILVTPRVIKHEPDEAASAEIKNDVERFRVGMRKGLRWWGRNRLAQGHLRRAKQDLRNGRRDRALWNVDSALSLEPRMEEAIRLKERLSEKAYWSNQSQYSSVKYVIQRMIMNEMHLPVERIIPPRRPRDAVDIAPDVRKTLGIEQRPEDPLSGEPKGRPDPPADDDAPSGKDAPAGADKPQAQVKPGPKGADDNDNENSTGDGS